MQPVQRPRDTNELDLLKEEKGGSVWEREGKRRGRRTGQGSTVSGITSGGKDWGFYSKCKGMTLKVFKQGSDTCYVLTIVEERTMEARFKGVK